MKKNSLSIEENRGTGIVPQYFAKVFIPLNFLMLSIETHKSQCVLLRFYMIDQHMVFKLFYR